MAYAFPRNILAHRGSTTRHRHFNGKGYPTHHRLSAALALKTDLDKANSF